MTSELEAPPPRPSSDTIGGGEHAGLIEEYRNLVKTGAEYAASELRLAPTSAFEIYMGHFRDIGRDIEAALSALQAPQYTGVVEAELVEALEYAREKMWAYGFSENDLKPIRDAITKAVGP